METSFDKDLERGQKIEREIKDPTLNIARGEVIIKERVNRFEVNDQIFFDFILG